MRAKGTFCGESWTRDRKLRLTFEVEGVGVEQLDSLTGTLSIEVKKWREKRTLTANAYFWVLCQKIAEKIRATKEAVYLLMLRDAGQFTDLEVKAEAVPMLQRAYRYTEVLGEEEGKAMVRCYLGSSGYNTEEMARLIDHTVDEAQALGIETMTPDELEHMKQTWKVEGYGY